VRERGPLEVGRVLLIALGDLVVDRDLKIGNGSTKHLEEHFDPRAAGRTSALFAAVDIVASSDNSVTLYAPV
jgi:hypothetical protein